MLYLILTVPGSTKHVDLLEMETRVKLRGDSICAIEMTGEIKLVSFCMDSKIFLVTTRHVLTAAIWKLTRRMVFRQFK